MRELTGQVQNLNLRAVGVEHTAILTELQTEALTTPLRCAPVVLRELGPTVDAWSDSIHPYSDSGLPAPGDGPGVLRLSHDGNAHTGRDPTDCQQCGRGLSAELRHLGVDTGGEWTMMMMMMMMTTTTTTTMMIMMMMMMTWTSPLSELCPCSCHFI